MNVIDWGKCEGNVWCPLRRINLEAIGGTGVYIIWWSSEDDGQTVRVGQGNLQNRISQHRLDEKIMEYEMLGVLYVTWAKVPENYMDGVERYLYDSLKPQVGQRAPDVDPIPVTLPWG